MTAVMDSEHSERIVLAIVTNLNTRFVVLPLRSETVGDIRGTIKSYHMNLFPTWGEVDVNALEVELLGGRSRVADPIPIGHLFWKASQAAVFAELIPSSSNTLVDLPRLKLGGATELNVVSEHELRQHPNEKTPSPPKSRGLVEGHSIPDAGASSYSNLGKSVLDHKIDHKILEGILLSTKKRGVDERESANDVGERQIPAECAAVGVVEPATKKPCIDRGHPVLEHNEPETEVSTDKHSVAKSMLVIDSKLKSNSPDGPASCQQSGPLLAVKVQEIALSPSKLTEKDVVLKSARALDFTRESNKRAGSGSRSQSDHPVAEKLRADPGLASPKHTEDSATKTLDILEPKHNSSSSDTSDSRQSGHPVIQKVQEEPGLATSKPDDKNIKRKLLAADASPGSSSSQSGTQTGSQNGITSRKQPDKVEVVGLVTPEKRVTSGGLQNLNVASKRGSLEIKNRSTHSKRHDSDLSSGSSSGGSTGETSAQNENSGERSVQGKVNSSSSTDGNSADSDAEEGSKPARPRESSVGKDSEQTTSDGDSSLQSSEGSESENIESSSDESDGSEEMPPPGRRMDFSTPKDGNGTARSIGRRSFGGVVDPKYQHLLDSQDGFDELISLSQQKLKVISGSQQEIQPPAEPHDSLAPVSLADDSLSIDMVPDTQVGDLNGNCVITDVQKYLTAEEPVENNTKETMPSTQESVSVRRSVIEKEMPVGPVQEGAEDVESLQCRSGPPTSVKLGEGCLLLSVKEELISTGAGGITEKFLEKELGEDLRPPQARSEDSQQIRAALQLARMSVATVVDSDLAISPSQKKVKRKQGISSLAAATGTRSKKMLEESSQHKDSPIRNAPVVLLHEADDDQRLEANKLVIVKPGSSTADGNQMGARFVEEAASDSPDIGRKKHRKRSYKVCEESDTEVPPQEDVRGHTNTVEDEPSRGGLDHPDNAIDEAAANKENSGKTPSFEYRDLRKRSSSLAINHSVPVEKKRLLFKRDKVPKFLNEKDRQGAEEEQQVDRLIGHTNEPVCPDPENNTHGVAPNNKKKSDHGERGVLENGDSPNEPIQRTVVEIRSPSSHFGKKKMKRDRKVESLLENRSKLHLEVNQNAAGRGEKMQVEDTEPPNLGFEDLSGLLTKESIDEEIEKEGVPTTGPMKEFGGQENTEVQLNGESPAKKKNQGRMKLSVEFLGRLKQSSTGKKKDRDSVQSPNTDRSASLPQELEKEGDENRHVLDEKQTNLDEENVVDKEYPVVLDVQKNNSKRTGQSSKSSKNARNLETITSLMTNQNVRKTQKAAENVPIPLGSVNVDSAEAQLPQELTETVGKHSTGGVSALHEEQRTTPTTDGAETVRSSLVEKTKRKQDKLKLRKKQSKLEAAEEETEQSENPTALGTEEVISRTERQDPETSPKKKWKKSKDLNVDPSVEGRKSEGELSEARQVEVVHHEDQIVTPESQEVVKTLKDSNGNTLKKKVRIKKQEEEVSLPEENGGPLQKKKVFGSRNSKTGNQVKRQQITPLSGRKRVKSKSEKSSEGETGDSFKRNASGRFQVDLITVHCPHGCGKGFSKKTSAFFRHRKSCNLARSPTFV